MKNETRDILFAEHKQLTKDIKASLSNIYHFKREIQREYDNNGYCNPYNPNLLQLERNLLVRLEYRIKVVKNLIKNNERKISKQLTNINV